MHGVTTRCQLLMRDERLRNLVLALFNEKQNLRSVPSQHTLLTPVSLNTACEVSASTYNKVGAKKQWASEGLHLLDLRIGQYGRTC